MKQTPEGVNGETEISESQKPQKIKKENLKKVLDNKN